MAKKHFFLKLIPCRPTFSQDMTEEERSIMIEHIAYHKKYMEKGVMLVFGPVLDPKGTYGVGIAAVNTEEQLQEIIKNDPAAKINTYEYYPMMAVTPDK